MPYIEKTLRGIFDARVDSLAKDISNVGDLNYTITRLAHQYLKKIGVKYANLSAVGGVLADVRDEYYRRVVSPYEDQKILDNGDVGVL